MSALNQGFESGGDYYNDQTAAGTPAPPDDQDSVSHDEPPGRLSPSTPREEEGRHIPRPPAPTPNHGRRHNAGANLERSLTQSSEAMPLDLESRLATKSSLSQSDASPSNDFEAGHASPPDQHSQTLIQVTEWNSADIPSISTPPRVPTPPSATLPSSLESRLTAARQAALSVSTTSPAQDSYHDFQTYKDLAQSAGRGSQTDHVNTPSTPSPRTFLMDAAPATSSPDLRHKPSSPDLRQQAFSEARASSVTRSPIIHEEQSPSAETVIVHRDQPSLSLRDVSPSSSEAAVAGAAQTRHQLGIHPNTRIHSTLARPYRSFCPLTPTPETNLSPIRPPASSLHPGIPQIRPEQPGLSQSARDSGHGRFFPDHNEQSVDAADHPLSSIEEDETHQPTLRPQAQQPPHPTLAPTHTTSAATISTHDVPTDIAIDTAPTAQCAHRNNLPTATVTSRTTPARPHQALPIHVLSIETPFVILVLCISFAALLPLLVFLVSEVVSPSLLSRGAIIALAVGVAVTGAAFLGAGGIICWGVRGRIKNWFGKVWLSVVKGFWGNEGETAEGRIEGRGRGGGDGIELRELETG